MWQIEVSSKSSGKENMEKDISMISNLVSPKIRIYGWSNDCISLGYSQIPEDEIDLKKACELNIEIVKRPTGGGMVFHNTDEVTYCVAAPVSYFPKGLKASYYFISEIITKALDKMGIKAQIKSHGLTPLPAGQAGNPSPIALPAGRQGEGKGRGFNNSKKISQLCFSSHQDYEITYNGKKLVGSAQKRTRNYILQQGTIAMSRPDNIFLDVLKDKNEIQKYNNNLITIREILNNNISFTEISNAIAKEFSLAGK